MDNNLVKNGNEMYYLGEKVNIKNPEKFEPIKISDDKYILYGKDDENIYVVTSDEKYGYFKAIKNADKDTFEVMEKDTRYSKDKNNVYYAGYNVVQLQDVDKDSFVIADENAFSYDKKNVYYAGRKLNDISSAGFKVTRLVNRPNLPVNFLNDNKNIYKLIAVFDEETGELKSVKTAVVKNPKVDSKTFETFSYSGNYFRDKNNVYYENELYKMGLKKIAGADRNSFEVLNDEFSRDKNNVYYEGEKVEGIDMNSIEVINGMCIKDKNSVFIGGHKIKEADSKTFERLPKTTYYSKDKNNLYYQEVKIDKIDNKTLKILYSDGIDVVKNGNRIFAEGEKLNIKSPETFEIILSKYYNVPNLIYGKDDKNVYVISKSTKFDETYSSKIIKNADVNSFEVMENSMYTKDKNNIYFTHSDVVQMKNVDKGSFTIGENGFSHDKNSVYFYGKKLDRISPQGFKIIDFTVNFGDSEKIKA